MDSKSIYISARSMLRKVTWEWPTAASEWSYLGDPADIAVGSIGPPLGHFSSESLYIVFGRHDSQSMARESASHAVAEALRNGKDVVVCDPSFQRFVEFNKIGLFRRGVVVGQPR